MCEKKIHKGNIKLKRFLPNVQLEMQISWL